MLQTKKKKRAMKENVFYCGKCNTEMKEVILPTYEYEEGTPLSNVRATKCPACLHITFTEEQADEMESRTNQLLKTKFSFERKLTTSGKSLVIGVPHELAEHLRLKSGKKVKIFPLENDGFIVRKMEA